MTIKRLLLLVLLLGSWPLPAAAQPYPTRPITLVVGYAPGGGTDALARLLASRLSNELKQPVIVSNRPGAAGAIAAEFVSHAAPDGYTLFFTESSLLLAPKLYPGLKFDPLRSFSEISGIASLPYGIVANPSFPAKDLPSLMALLKANPGKYNYASPGNGNIGHLSAEMLQLMGKVKLTHVPYQGGGKLLPDVMSGEVPLTVIGLTPVLPLVRSGKLDLLAVTSPSRHKAFPDVAAVAELLPGFATGANFFVLAPAGMPVATVKTLNAAIAKVLASKEVDDAITAQGAEIRPSTPAELKRQLAAETEQWDRIIKMTGIKGQ